MAVPRNRHSNARKNTKRAHDAKRAKYLCKCKSCGAAKASHTTCPECGKYAERQIIASS